MAFITIFIALKEKELKGTDTMKKGECPTYTSKDSDNIIISLDGRRKQRHSTDGKGKEGKLQIG